MKEHYQVNKEDNKRFQKDSREKVMVSNGYREHKESLIKIL